VLRNVKDLAGFGIEATDGALGHVRDFYFDDEAWVIRYLIVETGSWLSNRKVLVSPYSMGEPNWSSGKLPVQLTREQVRKSPDIDTKEPVSRQHELEYSGFYRYPYYWIGSGIWGAEYYPDAMLTGTASGGSGSDYLAAQVERERLARSAGQRDPVEPHLRSCNEVKGYHISAADGEIGHVQGMLVDEKSWAIRYLVINTSNWWLGHEVLVAPEWITDVSWKERTVTIDLTRQAIKDSPHWDPALLPDRPQEALVYQHYGRKGYWEYETLASLPPRHGTEHARAHS
jgi:uncharacterized protein YrrD